MKILIVSNMYPGYKDPAYGTFIKIMEEEMRKLYPKFDIEVVAIKGKPKSTLDKIRKYGIFYSVLLWKTLFNTYNLIYVHTITYPTPPLRISSIFRKLKIIFNVHGSDVISQSKFSSLLKRICSPLIKKSQFLVVPSEYFKKIVINELPISPDRIIISPSGGVEDIFFQNKPKIKNEVYTIGYVSRITKEKGWRTLIDALLIFDKYNIPFKVIIAGSGEDDNQLKLRLRESELSNLNSIELLGARSHETLSEIYQKIDIFVFPSERESLGLVGLEAMASGTPVIGSRIGGIMTYLVDQENGLSFSPSNPKELSDCLLKYYLLSPESKRRYSENAIRTATEYKAENVCKLLYNKLFTGNEK